MPKIPALTWLDRKVYSVVLYLFAMATISFGFNLAAKLGADPDVLVTLDWYTLVLFAVVLMVAVAVGLAQIRKQEHVVRADLVRFKCVCAAIFVPRTMQCFDTCRKC